MVATATIIMCSMVFKFELGPMPCVIFTATLPYSRLFSDMLEVRPPERMRIMCKSLF